MDAILTLITGLLFLLVIGVQQVTIRRYRQAVRLLTRPVLPAVPAGPRPDYAKIARLEIELGIVPPPQGEIHIEQYPFPVAHIVKPDGKLVKLSKTDQMVAREIFGDRDWWIREWKPDG